MTVKATPLRLQIALLNWFLDNEPLAGDLIEESAHRSRIWFWQQLMFALLVRTATRAAAASRDPADLLAPLASLAMFMVLCFQVVVAGSLLASVLPRARVAGQEWLALVVLLSLPVGWGTGKVVGPLRARSRVATVALCGASAAFIGLVVHVGTEFNGRSILSGSWSPGRGGYGVRERTTSRGQTVIDSNAIRPLLERNVDLSIATGRSRCNCSRDPLRVLSDAGPPPRGN